MSNLVFNPLSKEYFKARACVAISRRYNYAGSFRSYKFDYLCFYSWSSSYRAAFCYVLSRVQDSFGCSYFVGVDDVLKLVVADYESLPEQVICDILYEMKKFSLDLCSEFSVSGRLSFVYKLLDLIIRYNLGVKLFDLVSPMFHEKSAIRYAASKYFPDTPFIEIESDFYFKDVMD